MAIGELPENTKQPVNPNESDEVFNNAHSLQAAEQGGNQPADDTKSLQDQESNPDSDFKNNFTGKQKISSKASFLKKKGPLIGIILTLVGGGIGIGSLLSPGLAIIALKERLVSALNDSAPALSTRTMKMLAVKADGVKNSFDQSSDGSCNIKCKFSTMSDTMKRNLEAKGFTVESDSVRFTGRHVVTSIKFPDGTVTKNGAEFTAAMQDPARATSFNEVFDSKTAYFLNSKFGSILKDKFGLDKIPELAGKTKEEVIASLRKALGLEGASAATDPSVKLSPLEKVQAGKLKPAFDAINSVQASVAEKAGNVAGQACVVYDSAKGISLAVKTAKIAAFAGMAFTVLKLADQIKSGDSPDPAVVEQVGNQLTQTETNPTVTASDGTVTPNAFLGKSAFDSVGYKTAAYGDNPGTLSVQDQVYSAAPVSTLATVLAFFTAKLVAAGEPAIAVAHGICKVSNSLGAGIAMTCSTEILAALGGAVETGGLALLAGLAVCTAKVVAITVAMGIGIGAAVKAGTNAIVNDELPQVDENTIGAAEGDAVYTGSAQVLGGTAASYGLKAGTQADIKQYALNTAAVTQQNASIASYDARSTPLDATNQYSFLGSMIQKLNLFSFASSPLFSKLSTITSLIPQSFDSLVTSTSAASSITQATAKSSLYGACTDPGLASVNVAGDAFCNPSYVMSSSEMSAASNTVLDYMIQNNYIDASSGNPVPGTDYDKYMTNCANRVDPLGESGEGVEADDYAWKVGLKCTENSTELSNFRTYTMDKSINDTMDGDATTSSPAAPTTGSAQSLATQIIASPNIQFQTPAEKVLFQEIADTGKQTLMSGPSPIDGGAVASCDGTTQVPISTSLLSIVLNASQSYKITVGVVAAGHDCSGGYHPQGRAMDINGISAINQPFVRMWNWTGPQIAESKTFYEFVDAAAGKAGVKLELGQSQCFGNTPPQVSNSTMVVDTCNHIHIGIASP